MTTEQSSDNVILLTLAETAERLGISLQAVRKDVADGKLETQMVDGEQRVLWPDAEQSTPLAARHSGDDPAWLVPGMIIAAIALFIISALMLVYVAYFRPRF
jgi:hypothetical protein